MFLRQPRIEPLAEEQWDDETRDLLERSRVEGRVLNIFRTLAVHPKLLKRWLVFGAHVLFKSSLPLRERELLILRIGWLCRAEYEWGQHAIIGKQTGLTDEEIGRIKEGPDAEGWNDFDRTLLRAVDELHEHAFISDATWQALSERYDAQQLIDLIFTVGQYNLVSMALNTLGVQLDDGIAGFESVPRAVASEPQSTTD
jgi:alkylhydroperoxidase family enzyme